MRWKTGLLVALLLSGVAATEAMAEVGRGRRVGGTQVMPGGRVVDGTIVYADGAVVVHPVTSAMAFDSCPSGSVCLFSDPSWNGTMVELNAGNCCAWINLGALGFNNTAQSWRNRMGTDAQIAMNADGGGARLCLNNGSYDSQMSATWSNSATSIRLRDTSTLC